jgi:hypothetical protein
MRAIPIALVIAILVATAGIASEVQPIGPGETVLLPIDGLAFLIHAPVDGSAPRLVAVFSYGGDIPVPPPPPPVPTPGKKIVVTVMESKNPNPDHVLLLAQLTNQLEEQGVDWERTDPNDKENGETPAWLQPVLAKTTAADLPVVAVVAGSLEEGFVLVAVERLTTLDKATAFLKKHGVE